MEVYSRRVESESRRSGSCTKVDNGEGAWTSIEGAVAEEGGLLPGFGDRSRRVASKWAALSRGPDTEAVIARMG